MFLYNKSVRLYEHLKFLNIYWEIIAYSNIQIILIAIYVDDLLQSSKKSNILQYLKNIAQYSNIIEYFECVIIF